MKFNKRQQDILFKKLKPWNNYKECVGYLIPTEILYLISLGCKSREQWKVDYAEQLIKSGHMCSTWFYFTPCNEIKQLLLEKFQHKKHDI